MRDSRRRAVHEGLARRELRDGLAALLRRRVPREEVADLVQAVLCDALASERTPTEPDELARWVTGIARHKIADFRRRAGRLVLDERAVESTAPALPAPFEARRILDEVLSHESTFRDRETLDWMVREHAGEPLCAIAAEEGIPSPTVRQRVSRLRRLLRSKFAWVAALAFFVGGAAATQRAIAPELAAWDIAPERGSAFSGTWHVTGYTAPEGLPSATSTWLGLVARDATVRIGEGRVVLVGSAGTVEHVIRVVETRGDATVAELVDAHGRTLHAVLRPHGNTLVVMLTDETHRGSVTLVRR